MLFKKLNPKVLHDNFILKSDSYKLSHYPQYPDGTTKVYSYGEARGCTPTGEDGSPLYKYSVFFQLQQILEEHFLGVQVTDEKIEQAKLFCAEHFGTQLFNEKGWKHIVDKHEGKLPIRIVAVPEGTKVPLKNVLFVIENTDPECFWLTNYCETLLMQVWYGTTVATNSATARDYLIKYQDETCDSTFVDYSLHDFGARGGATFDSSIAGDMAHLISFNGTDTLQGIVGANSYYGDLDGFQMYGNSVAATEHSTMTSWGRDHERECILNLLAQYPTGIVSAVGDSYDVEGFSNLLHQDAEIKEKILTRDGKFVLRPDSGDPVEITEMLIKNLWEGFDGTINSKGFKVLNPKVGLLQGDGIDLKMMIAILENFKKIGFATSNIVFGSGGGLIQKYDRDTLKFAIKCSFAIINGQPIDVQKDPKTQHSKKSKKGRLALLKDENGVFYTKEECTEAESKTGYLQLVFENGVGYNYQSFKEVRNKARN